LVTGDQDGAELASVLSRLEEGKISEEEITDFGTLVDHHLALGLEQWEWHIWLEKSWGQW
jgi:hypothetical protein